MKTILADEGSSQKLRDFARTRLADGVGMGTYECVYEARERGGDWLLRNPEDYPAGSEHRKQAEDWLLVEAFEVGTLSIVIEPCDALAAASRAFLVDDTKISLRAERSWDGSTNQAAAYPKLTSKARSILSTSDSTDPLWTDAHIFLTFMDLNDAESAVDHLSQACSARPREWRVRDLLSAMLAGAGNHSMSLQHLRIAQDLVSGEDDDYKRWIMKTNEGKLLFNMSRPKEAIHVLEDALAEFGDHSLNPRMNDREVAKVASAQYMLCLAYAESNKRKKAKQHFKEAEEKVESIAEEAAKSTNLEARMTCQMMMSHVSPSTMKVTECHHCKKPTDKNLVCSRCKVATFCSKQCNAAAWHDGHKHECKGMAAREKKEKLEMKSNAKELAKKKKLSRQLPFLDGDLVPAALWKSAVSLTKKGDPSFLREAAWKFLVALYMDFSLDAMDMKPAIKAADGCGTDDPVALALSIATFYRKHDRNVSLQEIVTHHEDICDRLENETSVDSCVDEVDRPVFALGVAKVFYARIMARCHDVKSDAQAHDSRFRSAWRGTARLIEDAKFSIDAERWLTMQFELGYINHDNGATDRANLWLSRFVKNLEEEKRAKGALSKHWKGMKKNAEQKLRILPRVEQGMRSGVCV